jgi:L-lactate permease
MTWTRVYDRLGSLFISALVAAILGPIAALVVAIFVYQMPAPTALAAAFKGALFGEASPACGQA